MKTSLAKAESEVTKEKLMQDFRLVVTDTEELLRATAGLANEKVSAVRGRIQENLEVAKERLSSAEEVVVARTKQAARVTDDYVHENPWTAAGIGAGIGLLLGMLIARGR
jgi:ElaB/YqjD/DUF883 family membrane-anchored ribosome-binding protein